MGAGSFANRIYYPPGDKTGGGSSDVPNVGSSKIQRTDSGLMGEFPIIEDKNSSTVKNVAEKSNPTIPSDTSQPGESKASTTTESDQTTPATSGSTVGDKGFQPIGAVAKQFLEGKAPTDLPKPNDSPKAPEATQPGNAQALLSSQGIVATATDQLKPPESQRTGLPAAPTVTEQAPAKPTQDVAAQDKTPDVSSTQSKSAPQGDVAASIPLVSGAAASTLVTALNRDSPPPDQGKVASIADAAKGALAASEGKSPAAFEQPKSASLAGESARPVDASSASRAASTDVHGGYKSDFGSRTPVDAKASAGRLPHGLEGKGNIDKVAEVRAPIAGARNPVAGLLPHGELKGISNKLSAIDGFVGKSDKDARGARRSEGADTKTGSKLDGKSDSKIEGKQDGKFGVKPGDKAGEKGAGGSPLSGKNALLNNLTDKINERINKSGEKPGEKTNATLTDRGIKSGDRSSLSPAERLTDKSARPGEKPGMPLADKRPGDKPGLPTSDKKPGEKPGMPLADKRPGDKSGAPLTDKSTKLGDKTGLPIADKSSDKTLAPKGADRFVDGSRAPRAEQTISSRMMGVPILNNIAEQIMRLRPEPRADVADSRQTQKSAATGPRLSFVLKDIEIKSSSAGKRQDNVGSKGDAQSSKSGARPEAKTSSDDRFGAKPEAKSTSDSKPGAKVEGKIGSDIKSETKPETKPEIKPEPKQQTKADSKASTIVKPDSSARPPAAGSERVVKAEWGKVPDLSPHFDTGRLIPLLLPTGLKGIKVASQVENTTIIKDDGAPTARVARPEIRLHLPDGTYGGQKVVPGHRVPRFEESKAQEAATVPLKVWSDKPSDAKPQGDKSLTNSVPEARSDAAWSPEAKANDAKPQSVPATNPAEPDESIKPKADLDIEPLLAEPVDTTSTKRKRYVNPAIDALEETLSEEEDERQANIPSSSTSDSSSSSDSSPTSAASSTADLLLGASRQSKYIYTVKPGDTAESVATSELHDLNLAPLIVRKNIRHVMAAPAVGVTPLREGAQITLPNPAEIAAYRKAAQ